MQKTLNEQKKQLDIKDPTIYSMSAKNSQDSVTKHKGKLVEYAWCGSMKAACYNLQNPANSGLPEDKNTRKRDVGQFQGTFMLKKKGKHYRFSFKGFLEVLLLWGGPGIVNFVANNLGGPEIHSINRWQNQHLRHITGGIVQSNFQVLRSLYKEVTSVPVLPTTKQLIGSQGFGEWEAQAPTSVQLYSCCWK